MANETKHTLPKITHSTIDFVINKDVTVRFIPMSEDYVACVYYKGFYDGSVQNIRYTEATRREAHDIYSAYVKQELGRMSLAKSK